MVGFVGVIDLNEYLMGFRYILGIEDVGMFRKYQLINQKVYIGVYVQ